MGYNFQTYGNSNSDNPLERALPTQDHEIDYYHLYKFFETMNERQEIWYKRFMEKQPRPWSYDPYFRDYKFTNVYRELDNASQWLIRNVLTDHKLSTVDLLWKTIIFRFFNKPSTFDSGGVTLPSYKDWKPKKMWKQVVKLRESGENPWHTAYLMNLAFAKKPDDWSGRGLFKDEAYINICFNKVHDMVPRLASMMDNGEIESPKQLCKELEKLPATSGFQSHEFFIDFCYAAKYWKKQIIPFGQNDYTNVGPGASLGIRLIFPDTQPSEQIDRIYLLKEIAPDMLPSTFKYLYWFSKGYFTASKPNITLHQIEMWLCEYSKYWKIELGIGKQRSKYKPPR